MFDAFKSMGALAGLMRDKERLAEAAERVRSKLRDVRAEGQAGAGAVRVVASGELLVVSVHVEVAMASGLGADEASRAMAETLIAEATNAALERAREAAAKIVGDEMEAMGLPRMGGGIGNLLT